MVLLISAITLASTVALAFLPFAPAAAALILPASLASPCTAETTSLPASPLPAAVKSINAPC